MYAKSLITIAFTFFAFTTASAQEVSHTAQVIFAAGQEAPTLSIPAPAQNMGAPTQIEIQLLVGVRGSAGFENLSKTASQAMLYTTFGATVSTAKGTLQASGGGQFAQLHDVGAYDGRTDFDGKSGSTLLLQSTSDRQTQTLTGKSLAKFLADSPGKGIQFQVTGGSSSSLMGLEFSAQEIAAKLIVQVHVTYTYATPASAGSTGISPAQPFAPSQKQTTNPVAQIVATNNGNKK